MNNEETSRDYPETVCIGAMHRVKTKAAFPDNIQCVNCGALSDEFSKPCRAFMARSRSRASGD